MIPCEQTDKQTNGQTNGQTDGWTNICSLFRDKLSLPEGSWDMIQQGGANDPVFPQSNQTILNKWEFIAHNSVIWLVQFSLPTMATMLTIYDKPAAEWNKSKLMITSKIISKQVKRVMWYKKNTTPQQFEKNHIQLMTMRYIKLVCKKTNER